MSILPLNSSQHTAFAFHARPWDWPHHCSGYSPDRTQSRQLFHTFMTHDDYRFVFSVWLFFGFLDGVINTSAADSVSIPHSLYPSPLYKYQFLEYRPMIHSLTVDTVFYLLC